MTPVDRYILSKSQKNREILDFLNFHILDCSEGIKCTIKWSVPYYSIHKSLCYLNVLKSGEVELNFTAAFKYNEQIKQHLEFRGRSRIAGIIYRGLEDIDVDVLNLILEEGVRLARE